MRFTIFFALFIASTGMAGQQIPVQQRFDKTSFYSVMASGKLAEINNELAIVAVVSIPEKEAYEGALLMRKAGLLKKAADKLKIFRSGCMKLESALLKDSTNGEYHFLRLTIQEHAPGTLKYYKDLEKDSHYVHLTFKSLSPEIKKAITDYSKNSKTLHPEDFQVKNL